ncbi:hypothetical protein CRG98_013619 [Punica granatum]|nr:hypothetical protein CRG98_013619 [Punica granatum]
MAVCLSTLFGYMIATCMSNSSLCIYLVTLLSLLFLEAAVLVMIFFKIDWSKLIAKYIDEDHAKFGSFVKFHLIMIRVIMFTVLTLQVIVAVFAIMLWIIGTAPTTRHPLSSVPDFKQSFLVGPTPASSEEYILVQNDPALPTQLCSRCGNFCGRNTRESLLSYVKGVIFTRFRRTIVE